MLISVPAVFLISRKPQTQQEKSPELLILGIDGASWRHIDPLIQQGKMPNLASLIQNGVRATPDTLNPTISPAIWTTAATGKVPEKHGVRNFLATSTEYERELIGSDARHVKAIWNIFKESGKTVGLFSWWATWPPEDLDYVVSDLSILDPEEGIVPESLHKRMIANSLRIMGMDLLKGGFEVTIPIPTHPDDDNFFSAAKTNFLNISKLFNGNVIPTFDDFQPDIHMHIFGGIDVAQHMFTKFSFPAEYPDFIDPNLVQKYKDFIPSLYIEQDKLIGEFIKRAGPNTHIIVMSDHGFFVDLTTGYRFTNTNLILHHLGYLNYGEDGKIDFTNTLAFECNNNSFDWQRRLCINVQGKYINGIVSPEEFGQIRESIIQDLRSLSTTNGTALMNYVITSREANSDVQYDIRRDLIGDELLINENIYPVKNFLQLSVESGNHYSDPVGPPGIFVWKGPNIKSGVIGEIDYVDITPNILHALGYPIAKDMDGVYRPELFLSPKTPTYIDTYETDPKTLTITRLDSIENEDIVQTNGLRGYFLSNISDDDTFDRSCFTMPKLSTFGMKFDSHKKDNNEVLLPNAYIVPDQLPTANSKHIPYSSLRFDESENGKYNFIIPLEFNIPSFLGLWTNTFFRFEAEQDGWIEIIANGDSLNGTWPQLQIRQGIERITIDIDSTNYQSYTIPVQRGPVEIRYINDEIGNTAGEDRNVRIQNIYHKEETPQPMQPFITQSNDSICLTNTKPGKNEYEFTLVNLASPLQLKNISKEALDLLQHVGEIPE